MIQKKTIFLAHNWSDVSVSQQSKELAQALAQHNTVVFLNAKKRGTPFQQIHAQLLVYEWPGKRPTGLQDFLFALKLFNQYRPDIVITNFSANNIMLVTSWLARTKVRMCYHHTLLQQLLTDSTALSLKQRFFIQRKGWTYRLATHLLPVSSAAKQDLVRNYGVPPAKAFVFPNALVDRKLANRAGNPFTIGFIGRLDYSKGVDILITAFAQVLQRYPQATLVIGGDGKQRQLLEAQAQPFAANVYFKGSLAYEQVFSCMQSFTCLVVPSRIDNLPTVILEAFSCGTPVIASRAGGIIDMVEDGKNGMLVEPANATELAEKITSLLGNKEMRRVYAANARQTFLEKYAIDTLPERFEKLLAATGDL